MLESSHCQMAGCLTTNSFRLKPKTKLEIAGQSSIEHPSGRNAPDYEVNCGYSGRATIDLGYGSLFKAVINPDEQNTKWTKQKYIANC
jgi:hypothetical protein